jgi:hypothetical protein
MDIKTKLTIDSVHDNGCVSIKKETYSEFNGANVILEIHREALTPLDLEKAKEILPTDLLSVVTAFWTNEKIQNYKKLIGGDGD